MSFDAWLLLSGVALAVCGVSAYLILYRRHQRAFVGMSTADTLKSLVSHVPDDSYSAGLHITAGVLSACGISVVFGSTVAGLPVLPPGDPDRVGLLLTVAAFLFSIFVSVIAFWTLWQTRRLEQLQGLDIANLPALVNSLVAEIDGLINDLHARNFVAVDYHRLYLVTTNPFLGVLSFPNARFTDDFQDQLKHAAVAVKRCADTGTRFDFQILCGNEQALTTFHQQMYSNGGTLASAADQRVVNATKDTKEKLGKLIADAETPNIVHQISNVPKIQFAVVGNTVFEFVLDSVGARSEIHRTRRIRERVMCDRFVDTFVILKQLQ